MKGQFKIEQFGDRTICIGGVGKMFYQDGFPISMAVSEFKKKGIEVSIFHVADECLKNGWTPETTFRKLSDDFSDDIDSNYVDFAQLQEFCYSTYEKQREMIFDYLFANPEDAKGWLKNALIESNAHA